MARAAPSALLSDVSGKFSGLIVVNRGGGLVVRRPARYRRAVSPAQLASSERVRQVSALWAGVTPAQAQAWDLYARARPRPNRLTGTPAAPTGFNAFLGLATKVLQVDPAAEPPLEPPLEDFLGDPVTVSLAMGSVVRAFEPGRGMVDLGSGPELALEASGPNEPGSVTEVLLERLANGRRKPVGRAASAAFHRFEPGSLRLTLPVEPGWYLVSYRFVRAATGQTTLPLIAGKAEVTG